MPTLPAGRSRTTLLLTSTLLVAAACGGDAATATPPAVASVTVTPRLDSVVPGGTLQLSARATTASGSETSAAITWSSGDNAIATVSAAGLVTGVTPGTVEITGRAGGISGSATLRVRDGGVVGAAGGTVSAAQGAVALTIPAGALSTSVPVTVAPTDASSAGVQAVAGASYSFGPDGTQFAAPVTLSLTYDASKLPAGLPVSALRVGYYADGVWEPMLEGASVDAVTGKLSARIHHFSTYGVMAGNYCPRVSAGEQYLVIQPSSSWSDVSSTANTCQQKIAFSPYPETIGQTINTHDFLVTLTAGKSYTITLGGAIAGKAASLTVFRGASVAGQDVYDGSTRGQRTVQITPASTGQYDIEVSSGGFSNGVWVRPTFSYTLSVSSGQ